LDLDGTLLNAKKEVSRRNLMAVLRCHQNNIRIIIATARPPRSVRTILPEELLEISAFVYYNGALISDPLTGMEEHHPIPQQVVAEIVDALPHCQISIESMDRWFANQELSDESIYNTRFLPQVLETGQLKTKEATKILISDMNREALDELQTRFGEKVHIVVTDNGRLIQIMRRDVSKAAGVFALSNRYGVPPAEVLAFGDDYNDMELLQCAGYSVAMLNAVQELKDLADEVTDSNDNDGVATILERVVS